MTTDGYPPARVVNENVSRERAFHIICRSLVPGMRVLDIGCGLGEVGDYLAGSGSLVDGIEPDPVRAEAARALLNQVWTCRLEDAASHASVGAYSVVTILDVLEHLVSPVDGLEQAKNFLAPGGRLFLFVPNSAHWRFRLKMLKGDWSYQDWGLFDRTHLRFFDVTTAAAACNDAGFAETGRWYTSPERSWITRIGLTRAPSLFALHVLFELRPREATAS